MDAVRALELHKILEALAAYASSEPARNALRGLLPCTDANAVRERLQEVREADKTLYEQCISPSFGFDDLSVILDKADVMSVLSMGELLKVARLLRTARGVRVAIAKVPAEEIPRLRRESDSIYVDEPLEKDIDAAIASESEMRDNASPALATVRRQIKKTGETIKAKLQNFIHSAAYANYLQDSIVTMRGDRYVIPLKAECRGMIPGLIHDQSASGQTLYVEPMLIVELNNTLKTHILEEEAEIERILKAFTMRVSSGVHAIRLATEKLALLDVIFAKAKYANQTKAVCPEINDKGIIHIRKGRHPLIPAEKVVPTDIRVGEAFDMLLITGPNTGGKTVALKLTGLFTLMAMCGLYVPAAEATLSVFAAVCTDIGDEQSIEQNLSTFSSHIANIVRITNALTADTLVLLDELGAGTDPTEGAALAVSIASFLMEKGCKSVITTHYNELKEYAVVTERVENASMDFDPVTYNPTYRLIIGTPGASNALQIAEKLGLNPAVTARARTAIQGGKVEFENVLQALELARREAEAHRAEAERLTRETKEMNRLAERERERLFAQRERLNENVRKETKRLVEEAMEEANEIIASIKALLDEPTEENLFKARKLRKSLTQYIVDEENEFRGFGEEAEGALCEGDRVLVKSLQVEGVVESLNLAKESVVVRLGKLKSSFKLEDLTRLKQRSAAKKQAEPAPKPSGKTLRTESFYPELNIIGQNGMEAESALAEYLDRATRAAMSEVRIIHGQGTGRLREAVQRYLKTHAAVKSFRNGNFQEGSLGVTIVTLK